jgi:hypothetical protein
MQLFFIDKEDFIERFWLFISIGIENSVKKTGSSSEEFARIHKR